MKGNGNLSDLEWAIMAILAAVGECKPENISVNRCKYCDIIEAESKTGSVQFVFRQGFRSSLPHHTKTTLAELMPCDCGLHTFTKDKAGKQTFVTPDGETVRGTETEDGEIRHQQGSTRERKDIEFT